MHINNLDANKPMKLSAQDVADLLCVSVESLKDQFESDTLKLDLGKK